MEKDFPVGKKLPLVFYLASLPTSRTNEWVKIPPWLQKHTIIIISLVASNQPSDVTKIKDYPVIHFYIHSSNLSIREDSSMNIDSLRILKKRSQKIYLQKNILRQTLTLSPSIIQQYPKILVVMRISKKVVLSYSEIIPKLFFLFAVSVL